MPGSGQGGSGPPSPSPQLRPHGRGHPWGQQGRALLFAQTLPGAMWCCSLGGRDAWVRGGREARTGRGMGLGCTGLADERPILCEMPGEEE